MLLAFIVRQTLNTQGHAQIIKEYPFCVCIQPCFLMIFSSICKKKHLAQKRIIISKGGGRVWHSLKPKLKVKVTQIHMIPLNRYFCAVTLYLVEFLWFSISLTPHSPSPFKYLCIDVQGGGVKWGLKFTPANRFHNIKMLLI